MAPASADPSPAAATSDGFSSVSGAGRVVYTKEYFTWLGIWTEINLLKSHGTLTQELYDQLTPMCEEAFVVYRRSLR